MSRLGQILNWFDRCPFEPPSYSPSPSHFGLSQNSRLATAYDMFVVLFNHFSAVGAVLGSGGRISGQQVQYDCTTRLTVVSGTQPLTFAFSSSTTGRQRQHTSATAERHSTDNWQFHGRYRATDAPKSTITHIHSTQNTRRQSVWPQVIYGTFAAEPGGARPLPSCCPAPSRRPSHLARLLRLASWHGLTAQYTRRLSANAHRPDVTYARKRRLSFTQKCFGENQIVHNENTREEHVVMSIYSRLLILTTAIDDIPNFPQYISAVCQQQLKARGQRPRCSDLK